MLEARRCVGPVCSISPANPPARRAKDPCRWRQPPESWQNVSEPRGRHIRYQKGEVITMASHQQLLYHIASPVADATGNDVAPSGLIANSTTASVKSACEAASACRAGVFNLPCKSRQPGGRKIHAGGVSHRNLGKMSQSPEGDTSVIKKEK